MNRDGDVKYDSYTTTELQDALTAIDSERYPVNHQNLLAEFRARGLLPESPSPSARSDGKRSTESLESMAGTTLLSIAALVYGAYGVYSNDLILRTRGRTQHLHDADAWAFFLMVVVAVPTNLVRLYGWMRDGGTDSAMYRTANTISQIALAVYVGYLLLRLFRSGA